MSGLAETVVTNGLSAAALMVVALVFERRSAELAHTVWLLALVRLVMPPVVELGVPLLPAREAMTLAAGPSASTAPIASELQPLATVWSQERLIVLAWLTGALALLATAVVRSLRMRRRLGATRPVSASLRARVDELAAEIGLKRSPCLVVTDAVVSPLLWSAVGRSLLALPAELLARLTPAERDTLIVHELAHLRRCDHLVRHVELLVLAAQWWNPLAWWGCRRLRRAEERCCDALVARTLPASRRAYADGLLKTMKFLAARRVRSRLTPVSCVGEIDHWKGRLTMILDSKTTPRPSTPLRALVAAASLLLLALYPTLVHAGGEAETKRVTYSAENVTLFEALQAVAELGAIDLVVEPGLDLTPRRSYELAGPSYRAILDTIAERSDLRTSLEGSVLWIHSGSVAPSTLRRFTGEPIAMSLVDAPLSQVIPAFSEVSGVPMVLAAGVEGRVTLEIRSIPWDQALDTVLRMQNLVSETVDGTLVISPAG